MTTPGDSALIADADLFPARYGYRLSFILREALKQRAKPEDDYHLQRPHRWLLTAKAIVCLLLKRDGHVYCAYPGPDAVTVAMLDGGSYSGDYGTHYWYHGLAVSLGWRHWRIEVYSDGAP